MVTPEGELRSGSQSLFLSEVEVLSTLSHPNIVRCGPLRLVLRPPHYAVETEMLLRDSWLLFSGACARLAFSCNALDRQHYACCEPVD